MASLWSWMTARGDLSPPTMLAVEDRVFQQNTRIPRSSPLPWVKSFLFPLAKVSSSPGTVSDLVAEGPSPPVPLYPILQDSTPEEVLLPPSYSQASTTPTFPQAPAFHQDTASASSAFLHAPALAPSAPAQPILSPRGILRGSWSSVNLWNGVGRSGTWDSKQSHSASKAAESKADSTVLPLTATRPVDQQGNQPHHYWPFTTADLYNWKREKARFSDSPRELIDLLNTILLTHQPTWNDCHQLFTIEENECIYLETRKNVPGDNGTPTQNSADIDDGFLLRRPAWDYNLREGREHIWVYRQSLDRSQGSCSGIHIFR